MSEKLPDPNKVLEELEQSEVYELFHGLRDQYSALRMLLNDEYVMSIIVESTKFHCKNASDQFKTEALKRIKGSEAFLDMLFVSLQGIVWRISDTRTCTNLEVGRIFDKAS